MTESKTKTTKRKTKTSDPETIVSDPEKPVKRTRAKTVKLDEKPTPKLPAYYRLDRILKENADYNLIVGERGNGKSYAIQEYILSHYFKNGGQFFLMRRWMEDVKDSSAQNFLDGNLLTKIKDMSNGRFTTVIYRNKKYIAVNFDDKGKPIIDDSNTIGYVWDVSESERLKSQSFPRVENIVYEEFISLSERGYISDEITLFLHIVSTIVRDRTNVKVWLLGNTVNPYNPFFNHFGIKGMELKQGEIWTKTDNLTGCKVAVEFCEKRRKNDLYGTSAKYYAFGDRNGVTDSIVSGAWQIPDYPTMKFKEKESRFKMLIIFDDKMMYFHLMYSGNNAYCYVQKISNKTQIPKKRGFWVLDLVPNVSPNYYTAFENLPVNDLTTMICDLLNNKKIWFDEKMTGSYFYNFVAQSQQNRINRMGRF